MAAIWLVQVGEYPAHQGVGAAKSEDYVRVAASRCNFDGFVSEFEDESVFEGGNLVVWVAREDFAGSLEECGGRGVKSDLGGDGR